MVPRLSSKRSELIFKAYQESRLDVRHIENARLAFTSVYAVLNAAVFRIIPLSGATESDRWTLAAIAGSMFLTAIIGLLVTLKVSRDLDCHTRMNRRALDRLLLGKYVYCPMSSREAKRRDLWATLLPRYRKFKKSFRGRPSSTTKIELAIALKRCWKTHWNAWWKRLVSAGAAWMAFYVGAALLWIFMFFHVAL